MHQDRTNALKLTLACPTLVFLFLFKAPLLVWKLLSLDLGLIRFICVLLDQCRVFDPNSNITPTFKSNFYIVSWFVCKVNERYTRKQRSPLVGCNSVAGLNMVQRSMKAQLWRMAIFSLLNIGSSVVVCSVRMLVVQFTCTCASCKGTLVKGLSDRALVYGNTFLSSPLSIQNDSYATHLFFSNTKM